MGEIPKGHFTGTGDQVVGSMEAQMSPLLPYLDLYHYPHGCLWVHPQFLKMGIFLQVHPSGCSPLETLITFVMVTGLEATLSPLLVSLNAQPQMLRLMSSPLLGWNPTIHPLLNQALGCVSTFIIQPVSPSGACDQWLTQVTRQLSQTKVLFNFNSRNKAL